MADQIEITDPDGGTRRVPIGPDGCTIGSGSDATVRLPGNGIEAVHLRVVPASGGMRLEPVRAGTTVDINGEALFCKDLTAGDRFELGGFRLRWLSDFTVPAASRDKSPRGKTKGARTRTAAGGRSTGREKSTPRQPRLARRSRGIPSSVSVLLVITVVLLAAMLVLSHLRKSTWPSSPHDYIELARTQLANRQAQRALETLAFALANADGADKVEAQQLEKDIRRMLVSLGEAPKVQGARQDHDLLLGFVDRYLRDGVARPAAREFVRECDRWLQEHRELCAHNADGQPLLADVEAQRARYVGSADLASPDTAADVLFAARSRLRFQWRDYRGAVARLDEYLKQHPDAAEVQTERASYLKDGEPWLSGKLKLLDQLIARGDDAGAEKDLGQIERWSMLPEWAPMVQAARQRLLTTH